MCPRHGMTHQQMSVFTLQHVLPALTPKWVHEANDDLQQVSALEQLTQDHTWDHDDIRSSFSLDLTGFVIPEGEEARLTCAGGLLTLPSRRSRRTLPIVMTPRKRRSASCNFRGFAVLAFPIRCAWRSLGGSNVLIRDNGRACISDFGLSTLLTELGGSTFVTSHQGGGALRWAAPELLHLNAEVSADEENAPRAPPTFQGDIYSFGGIMPQVLTGKIPYHHYYRDAQVVLAISRWETPKRPSQPPVTDRRWSFIQRCWTFVGAGESRPSDEEIVEFTRSECVENMLYQFWKDVSRRIVDTRNSGMSSG
ncbi:kinase-like protein [Gyrodon lividus]|nr:kinase-like protein [Gyrodon lividus]